MFEGAWELTYKAQMAGFSIRNRIELFEGLALLGGLGGNQGFSIRNRIELFEGTRATRANHRTADVSVSATGSNCLKAVNTDDAALLIDRSFSIRNRIELFEGLCCAGASG